jgi:hypothetical protein
VEGNGSDRRQLQLHIKRGGGAGGVRHDLRDHGSDAHSIMNATRLQGTLKEGGDVQQKVEKVKPEKVNMTDRKSDSGSDSSWFVQAG